MSPSPVAFPSTDRRILKRITAAAAGAVLGACTVPPKIAVGPNPADVSVLVPALAYQPVTGGVKSFRPVEPKGWEELNRQVTPKGN
jgi:hypothetical protein